MSDGATAIEAVANVADAIVQWIEQAKAMGQAVPAPTRRLMTA